MLLLLLLQTQTQHEHNTNSNTSAFFIILLLLLLLKKNWRAAGLELTTSAPSRTIVTDIAFQVQAHSPFYSSMLFCKDHIRKKYAATHHSEEESSDLAVWPKLALPLRI